MERVRERKSFPYLARVRKSMKMRNTQRIEKGIALTGDVNSLHAVPVYSLREQTLSRRAPKFVYIELEVKITTTKQIYGWIGYHGLLYKEQ
jgi:hypothetical protein